MSLQNINYAMTKNQTTSGKEQRENRKTFNHTGGQVNMVKSVVKHNSIFF